MGGNSVNDRQIRCWHIFADRDQLITSLRTQLLQQAAKAIEEHGRFNIVLAGGETPAALYRSLVEAKTDWQAWYIYFGDERCLPQGDSQRNDQMAKVAWLNQVGIPSEQIYSIPAELGAKEGARQLHAQSNHPTCFDLVLLGLGKDGHTASLFPNDEPIVGSAHAVAVMSAPKPPAERISLSAQRLSQTHQLFFIVTGSNKRDAVNRWRSDAPIPASTLTPNSGVDIFLDYLAIGW